MSRRTGESGALKTGKYRLTLTRRSDGRTLRVRR